MDGHEAAADQRALSEATGVAILVAVTVVVTGTVGMNVLVADQDTGPPDANFSYEYIDQSSVLLITHDRGSEFPAGELVIEGPNAQTTWADAAGTNGSTAVGPSDTIQISERNAYGQPVERSDRISIAHVENESQRELSSWNDDQGSG